MEHLSEESKDNKLVLFNKRISTITYPRCQKHAAEIYDLHRKQCIFPICDHEFNTRKSIAQKFYKKQSIVTKTI